MNALACTRGQRYIMSHWCLVILKQPKKRTKQDVKNILSEKVGGIQDLKAMVV